jgi:hypothetical protein
MKGCGTGINRKGAKMQWEAEPHNNLQLKGECFWVAKHCKIVLQK